MKYKLGDKVKIVSTHVVNLHCNITSCKFFASRMQRFIGKEAKIIEVNPSYYLLNLPNQSDQWSDCMVEELLKMNATKKKVHKMKNLFKFGRKVEQHINARAKFFHQEGLQMDYILGELPKCKAKKLWVDPNPPIESVDC